MSKSAKTRIEYLDVAKGITILLMVAGHIYDNQVFRNIIYAFHMPLFVIVSGMVISENKIRTCSWKDFFVSKFKSLMVPYICTEICVIPLYCIKYGYGFKDLQWILLDSALLYVIKGSATWFLLNLFVAELIYFLLLKWIKNKYVIMFLCTCALVISFIFVKGNYTVVFLVKSLNFLFFLMIGHQFLKKITKWDKKWIILTIPFLLSALKNGFVVCADPIYNNEVLFLTSALMGTVVIFSLSELICKYNIKEFFVFWGRNTLIVVCTHLIFMRYGIDVLLESGPTYKNVLVSITIFGVVMLVEWILIKGNSMIKNKIKL